MWGHAEYIKLLRSLRDGRIFDMPPQTAQRYLIEKNAVKCVVWRFNQKSTSVPAGFTLRIELLTPAAVVWTSKGWTSTNTGLTHPTRVGVCFFDISTTGVEPGTSLEFTFRWANGEWEGHNFDVQVV